MSSSSSTSLVAGARQLAGDAKAVAQLDDGEVGIAGLHIGVGNGHPATAGDDIGVALDGRLGGLDVRHGERREPRRQGCARIPSRRCARPPGRWRLSPRPGRTPILRDQLEPKRGCREPRMAAKETAASIMPVKPHPLTHAETAPRALLDPSSWIFPVMRPLVGPFAPRALVTARLLMHDDADFAQQLHVREANLKPRPAPAVGN